MLVNSSTVFMPIGSYGDLFVLNGAINYMADNFTGIIVPVIPVIYEIAVFMFKDNNKIKVKKIDSLAELNSFMNHNNLLHVKEFFLLRLENCLVAVDPTTGQPDSTTTVPLWDEQWYTLLDIPFSIRYSRFLWPKIGSKGKKLYDKVVEKDYILVSNEVRASRVKHELNIDYRDYQVIELTPDLSKNPFYYLKLIENAKEIHCVNSSMFCLIDSIASQLSATLYYHNSRKTLIRVNNFWNQEKWHIVEYPKINFIELRGSKT